MAEVSLNCSCNLYPASPMETGEFRQRHSAPLVLGFWGENHSASSRGVVLLGLCPFLVHLVCRIRIFHPASALSDFLVRNSRRYSSAGVDSSPLHRDKYLTRSLHPLWLFLDPVKAKKRGAEAISSGLSIPRENYLNGLSGARHLTLLARLFLVLSP